MPNGQPSQLANLKPFKPGHKSPRASAAKLRALTRARLASPKMVDIAVAIAKDVEEPSMVRLKAVESVLRVAFPAKNLHVDELTVAGQGAEWLELRFVAPGEARSQANGYAQPETLRISFDGAVSDVEDNETSNVG